jgi:hypothetical protein
MTGAFMRARSRCRSPRSVASGITNKRVWEKFLDYAGIGIVAEIVIESTVSVTTKASDSEPIASRTATALVSPDEATGAERASKPAAPGDRFMAGNPLHRTGEAPVAVERFAAIAGDIAAARGSKKGEMAADAAPVLAISSNSRLGGDARRILDFGAWLPVHRDIAR